MANKTSKSPARSCVRGAHFFAPISWVQVLEDRMADEVTVGLI